MRNRCGAVLAVAVPALLAAGVAIVVAQEPPATQPAATQPAATSQPTLVDFKSDEHGVAVSYLSTWKPQPTDKPGVLLKPQPQDPDGEMGEGTAWVLMPEVKSAAADKPPTFDELQAAVLEEAAKGFAPDVKSVVSTDATLGGEKARRVILTASASATGDSIRAVLIVTVHNGKGYAIAMASAVQDFSRRRDGFDRLAKTFKFTG